MLIYIKISSTAKTVLQLTFNNKSLKQPKPLILWQQGEIMKFI